MYVACVLSPVWAVHENTTACSDSSGNFPCFTSIADIAWFLLASTSRGAWKEWLQRILKQHKCSRISPDRNSPAGFIKHHDFTLSLEAAAAASNEFLLGFLLNGAGEKLGLVIGRFGLRPLRRGPAGVQPNTPARTSLMKAVGIAENELCLQGCIGHTHLPRLRSRDILKHFTWLNALKQWL